VSVRLHHVGPQGAKSKPEVGLMATKITAAVKLGYPKIAGQKPSLLLIFDDSSQKVHLQPAGPANQWFSWGFGSQLMPNTPAVVFNSGFSGNFFEFYLTG